MATTRVDLIGAARVVRDGRGIALPVRKSLALVVYLAVEGSASRVHLADLFWSGLDEATARRNLRRALHRLRAAGLGDVLLADDDRAELRGVAVDLLEVAAALRAERWADVAMRPADGLCDGLDLDDAPEFDDWLRRHRERYRREWRDATRRHADALEAAGDLRAAAAAHARLIESDPLQEASHRDRMRLLDALGDRAGALEAWSHCERVLRDELRLEPLPQTRLLAERIRGRAAVPGPPVPEPAGRASAGLDLQSIPLVARERELATIAASAAPVLLVEGDPGVGKSRLAREAARGVHGDALVVRFGEMSASTPFQGVADALRAPAVAARLGAVDPAWRRELARLLPELRDASHADPPAGPGDEARSRLLEALAQALAAAAGPAGSVVFDDLHWADASSLELLVHLAHRRSQAPGTMPRVIATARVAELEANVAAQVALADVARAGELARLPLGAFDAWSMLQLVQRLSRSEGGVRFATRLGSATGGNVFFALETIRALFEGGELRADPAEGWSTRYDSTTTDYAELPLPASVVEAVRSRVARLGPAARRVLETAALAEDGSTLAELQGATALTEWEALEGIERAIAARVVDRDGPGYRFVHELFRSALRSALSPERQRLTHAKLAAALEPLHAAPARIAAHWQQAGDTAAACAAWTRAAEAAMQLGASREAGVHFARAAALCDDAERAYELSDKAFDRMTFAGTTGERLAMLAALQANAERCSSPTIRFRALTRASQSASDDRDFRASEALALRAVREFEAPDLVFHVHALSCAAFAAGMLDRPDDALALYREAADVARAGGNARAEAMMAAAASCNAAHANRLADARALREVSLRAVQHTLGTLHHAQALCNCSFIDRADGDRATAIDRFEQAIAIGLRVGAPLYLEAYRANLCETLVDDGRFHAAREVHAALVAGRVDGDAARPRYLGALTAAVVHEASGALGDAIAAATAAIAASDAAQAGASDRREARLLAARLLIAVGAGDRAIRWIEQAEALVPPEVSPDRLLPAAVLRAALDADPERAAARVYAALRQPLSDRQMAQTLAAARLAVGRAELARGDAAAALAAVDGLRYSVALEAEALALRLAAALQLGRVDAQTLAEAEARVEGAGVPPLQALALMRTIAAATPGRRRNADAAARQRRMQALAQSLADSLHGAPPLQAAFIRSQRDLLT